MSEVDVYGMARDPGWAAQTVFGVLCRSCNSRKRDRLEVAP